MSRRIPFWRCWKCSASANTFWQVEGVKGTIRACDEHLGPLREEARAVARDRGFPGAEAFRHSPYGPRREVGMGHVCAWCDRRASFEIVARWSSFWACDQHDVEMAQDCADRGVNIIDIAKRR